MKKTLLILAVALSALTGCSTTNYEAYAKSTQARETRLTAEATSRQLVDQTLMLQVAKVGNDCKDAACQMGVLLVLSNLKNQATQAIHSAVPAIAAPANEVLEWAKLLVPALGGAYNAYLGTVMGIVNSTKGAANTDTANNALTSITPISPFAPTPSQ